MNADIGKLSVKIDANTTGFYAGVKDVQKSVKKIGAEMRDGLNKAVKWGAGLSLAAAGAGAAIVKSNLSAIRELRNMSQAADTSVADFQRLSFAASQYGISQEKTADILKDFNDRIGDFRQTGAGPMVDFFEQIAPKVGVTAEQFNKLSGKDALQLYVTSLEKANLSQKDMTFFMEAMASDSTQLLPLLENNAEALGKMEKEARELGIGLSAIDVENAIQAQAAIDRVTATLKNQTQEAVAELAPVIELVADDFLNLMKNADDFAIGVIEAIEGVARTFAWVGNIIQGWKAIFAGLKVAALGFTSLVTRVIREMVANVADAFNYIVAGFKRDLNTLAEIAGYVSDDLAATFREMAESADGAMVKVPQFIEDVAASQAEGLQAAINEFNAIAAEPLPTAEIDAYFEDLKARFLEVKEARNAALGGQGENTGQTGAGGATGTGEGEDEETPEDKIIALQNQLQTETDLMLEMLGLRYNSQEQQQLEHLAIESAQLEEAHKRNLISEEEYNRRSNELTKKKNATERALVWGGVNEILNVAASGSKKMLKLQKAVNLAQAGMAIATGIAKAQELGFPANIAEAARVVAVGIKAIQGIKSAKAPGAVGSGTPRASAPASPLPAAGAFGGGGGQPQQPARRIDVVIEGEGLLSTDQVRGLIGQINSQTGDGVIISSGG